jgi:hypothetical protein
VWPAAVAELGANNRGNQSEASKQFGDGPWTDFREKTSS